MRLLIVSYSRTGNNRLLAKHLAMRLHAVDEEIRPKGWRTILSLILDMVRDRRPRISPLQQDVAAFDHVLFIAPLWDMNIAHPMKTALETARGKLHAYSFVTLCGYHRDGQAEHVRAELEHLTGLAPAHVMELQVADLFDKADRAKVGKVTPRRIRADELPNWQAQIDEVIGWFPRAKG